MTAPTVGGATAARGEVATWPLDRECLEIAAEWLADERNTRLMDFGIDPATLTPPTLKLMTSRSAHCIWVYGPAGTHRPVGLVGLGDIHQRFGRAELWYVLGDKAYAGRHLTTRAVAALLDHGFGEMGLHCVHAWTVEGNVPSLRILERMGFRPAGRLRESHRIGDRRHDRLWFDLLAHEYLGRNDDDMIGGRRARHDLAPDDPSGALADPDARGNGNGAVESRVHRIFLDVLELDVGVDTEVVEDELLDSLGFVQLLVELEKEFGIEVDVAQLELEDFGSVGRIARYVEARRTPQGPIR